MTLEKKVGTGAIDHFRGVLWSTAQFLITIAISWELWTQGMRKLIAFDDDTFDKLKQLARDRMATFQELADEAFADLLKKHGIPIDLKDALRKSARLASDSLRKNGGRRVSRKDRS
jgi:hypothetical protein